MHPNRLSKLWHRDRTVGARLGCSAGHGWRGSRSLRVVSGPYGRFGTGRPAVTEREWLVYINTEYYPWAEIVPAATAKDAAEAVDLQGLTGGVVAVPFDPSQAYVIESFDGELEDLRESGRISKELHDRG